MIVAFVGQIKNLIVRFFISLFIVRRISTNFKSEQIRFKSFLQQIERANSEQDKTFSARRLCLTGSKCPGQFMRKRLHDHRDVNSPGKIRAAYRSGMIENAMKREAA